MTTEPNYFPKGYKIPLNTEVVAFTAGSNHVPIIGKIYDSLCIGEDYVFRLQFETGLITTHSIKGDLLYPVNAFDHPSNLELDSK
jgi:hypothetical protein